MYLKRIYKEEDGAAGIFMILFILIVLLGFSALVVDAGILYSSRRQMVTAADAGALAGAQEMERSIGVTDAVLLQQIKSEATRIAKETAIVNGAIGDPQVAINKMNVTLENGFIENRDVVQVNVKANESLIFGRFLGNTDQDVAASAVATWGIVRKTTGGHILPIYLTEEAHSAGIDYLHSEKVTIDGIEYPNNTGYIYIDPAWNGQSVINNALAGNTTKITMYIGQEFEGKPGQANSLVGAIEERMITANSLPTRLERERFMHGLVPIVSLVRTQGNQLFFAIEGFAVYEILDIITTQSNNLSQKVLGSQHALLSSEYKSVGSGNQREYHPSVYGLTYPKGTIIGRMTGEVRQLSVVIEQGDQLFDSDDTDAAKYSKLVR